VAEADVLALAVEVEVEAVVVVVVEVVVVACKYLKVVALPVGVAVLVVGVVVLVVGAAVLVVGATVVAVGDGFGAFLSSNKSAVQVDFCGTEYHLLVFPSPSTTVTIHPKALVFSCNLKWNLSNMASETFLSAVKWRYCLSATSEVFKADFLVASALSTNSSDS